MTPNAIRWESPPLSTMSIEAAISYRDGIAALVSGIANAERLLASATTSDPGFVIAHVGLAVCRVAAAGGAYRSPVLPASVIGRGERQHVEIVETTFRAEYHHAVDLRREHLLEYPADLLIVWLPALRCRVMGRDPVDGHLPSTFVTQ